MSFTSFIITSIINILLCTRNIASLLIIIAIIKSCKHVLLTTLRITLSSIYFKVVYYYYK